MVFPKHRSPPSPLLKREDMHEDFDSHNGTSVIETYKPRHTYQLWQGKNKFFCGGRWITGPDWYRSVITFFLIIIPGALFYGFESEFIYKAYGPLPLIVVGILICVAIALLFAVACTDPGILPRYINTTGDVDSLSEDRRQGRSVAYGRYIIRLKYCDTCHFLRPHRAHHCNTCDNCVERFDHHCPWIGNCVGRRNYRYFFIFLVTLNVLDLLIMVFSFLCMLLAAQDIAGESSGGGDAWIAAIEQYPIPLALLLYGFLFSWFIIGLLGYHSYLLVYNKTTYEHMKKRKQFQSGNPYYEGQCSGCKQAICASRGPSKLDLRTRLSEQRDYQANTVGGSVAPPPSASYNADELPAPEDRFDPEDMIESVAPRGYRSD